MSKFYNVPRTRNIFDPQSEKPFKLSRSKIDLFLECPKCFYIDRRLGMGRPPGFPFNLNVAVDSLLKNEFDIYRAQQIPHPMMEEKGLNGIPFQHEKLNEWRENFKGVRYHHEPTNLILSGAVDDVWVTTRSLAAGEPELIVVDYKATSKKDEVNINAGWQIGYKRQIEFYQYLLRKNGFKVSNTGYFVYCNGIASADRFDKTLHFRISLLDYNGNDGWVDKTVVKAHQCLMSDQIPKSNKNCDYCLYISTHDVLTK